MTKKLLCLFIIFFAINSLKAQDKKNSFDNAVDYCNCKITYAYLNQLTSSNTKDKSDKESFDNIKSNFNCEIGKSIDYQSLSHIMNKNNFVNSNQKVSAIIDKIKEKYTDNLTDENSVKIIIDGIYSNPSLTSVVSKFSTVANLKGELTTNLSKYLTKAIDTPKQHTGTSSETELQNILFLN